MLLDTHVLLWMLDDNRLLGPGTRERLSQARTVLFSAASAWELVIKQMLGRLEMPADLVALLTDSGLVELPVRAGHALAMQQFTDLNRHDPFDRLLVAQAAAEGVRFVTADRTLLAKGIDFVEDARA